MEKAITVSGCQSCPHKEHRGGFGRVSYVPYCRVKHKTIPHTTGLSYGIVTATPVAGIPPWCPLPDRE